MKSGPGPGTYKVESAKNCLTSTKGAPIGMAKRRGITEPNSFPGPGKYSFRTKVGDGPKTIMQGKAASQRANDFPGPGTYPQKGNIGKGPHAVMEGKPAERAPNSFPGPGTYPQKERIGEGPKAIMARKGVPERPSLVPGPGTYNPPPPRNMTSATFTHKPPPTRPASVPGPGAYTISEIQSEPGCQTYKAKGFSFGNEKR